MRLRPALTTLGPASAAMLAEGVLLEPYARSPRASLDRGIAMLVTWLPGPSKQEEDR